METFIRGGCVILECYVNRNGKTVCYPFKQKAQQIVTAMPSTASMVKA